MIRVITSTHVGLADASLPARIRIAARACVRGVSLPTFCLLRS